MTIVYFKYFCCGCSLYRGTLLIGVYFCFISSIIIAVSALLIDRLPNLYFKEDAFPGIKNGILVVAIIYLVIHLLILLINFCLLLSLCLKEKFLAVAWVMVHSGYSLLYFLVGVAASVIHFVIHIRTGILSLFAVIITTGIHLYFLLIVNSYVKTMLDKINQEKLPKNNR